MADHSPQILASEEKPLPENRADHSNSERSFFTSVPSTEIETCHIFQHQHVPQYIL